LAGDAERRGEGEKKSEREEVMHGYCAIKEVGVVLRGEELYLEGSNCNNFVLLGLLGLRGGLDSTCTWDQDDWFQVSDGSAKQ